MADTYTAILWDKHNDANSIDPLEATDGDYEFWTQRAGVDTPAFRKTIADGTGVTASIFEGDVPEDAPWGGTDKPELESAYVEHAWDDDTVRGIVAKLMDCEPEDVTLKRIA